MINSLQLTRLARGKLERDLPARMCENEWGVARAAGQLPLASSGCCAKLEAVGRLRESDLMVGGPATVLACDLPLAYRLWRRITSEYTNPSAMPSPLIRLAVEWPVRLAAKVLIPISGIRFPSRAIGGWWWIWRYRFEMVVGWYEFPTAQWIRRLLRDGTVSVDIGAHIGYFTRVMGKAVGPSGHVFAFEPSPENFPLLSHNIRRARIGNATCSQVAVADHEGQETLYISPGHSNHSLVAGYTESQGAIPVAATTLDAFLHARGATSIGMVKIDAEGAEPRILQGMSQAISRNPDLVLVIEVNPRALECAASSAGDLMGAIEAAGLIPRLIDPLGRLVEPRGRAFDGAPNLLCMREHMWRRLAHE